MAQWHLDDPENALERRGWEIVSRQEDDDDRRIFVTWAIQRSRKVVPLLIDFEELDDSYLKSLPMEQSCGCHVQGNELVGLYFSRKGDKSSSHRAAWKENLSDFVA